MRPAHLLRLCSFATLLLAPACDSGSDADTDADEASSGGSGTSGGGATSAAGTSNSGGGGNSATAGNTPGGNAGNSAAGFGGMPESGGAGNAGESNAAGQGGEPAEPEDPAAALREFRWEMGCTEPREGNLCALFPPNEDTCPAEGYFAQDEQIVFGGEAGTVYDVTLHIQGTGEAGDYTGGEAMPEEFLIGATHVPGLHNLMSLEVSEPAQLYFPNAGAGGGSVQVYDYMTTIPIQAGATLTFKTYDSDCLHHRYCQDNNTNPCVGLSIPGVQEEPFDGAFLHITVVSVEAQ